jgi:hypothetical protein
MYTLGLAGIIGLGLGATGCGPGVRHGGGSFDAAWSLAWVGGGSVSCAGAGVTEVDLDVQDSIGVVYHDPFVCSAGGGVSEILPADDYTVAVRAYDSSDNMLSEVVLPGVYSIYANTTTGLPAVVLELTPLAPQGGSFQVAWSLYQAGAGSMSCADAGVTEVDLDVQDLSTSAAYHDTFACSAYGGTSQVLPVDNYSVAVRAYDASNALVSEWVSTNTYPINAGRVTNLPDVALTL